MMIALTFIRLKLSWSIVVKGDGWLLVPTDGTNVLMSTTGFNVDRGGVESSTGNGEVGTIGRGTFGCNIVLQKEGQKKQSSSFSLSRTLEGDNSMGHLDDTLVGSIINHETGTWKLDSNRHMISKDEEISILKAPIGHKEDIDRLIWPYEKSGRYTIKSCYH
ncbi:unnamed protein product, partial [Prunus brigantina]